MEAMKPLASIARGTFLFGLTVSPTWHAAASNAGAAKPIRYSPAMKPVTSPNQPANGVVRWKVVACFQSTSPATTGASPEMKARTADAVAIGIASRPAHFTPHRLTAAKASTSVQEITGTDTLGRNHSWMAAAEKIAVKTQVGTHPHQ